MKWRLLRDFNNISYDVKTEKVNGLDIGMKQRRKRAFFIGKLDAERICD